MNALFPSLGLSNNEASAMTFYELSAPKEISGRGLLSRVGKKLRSALHTMQYGRLMRAMSQLSNEQLDTIGIQRADIPSVARRILEIKPPLN